MRPAIRSHPCIRLFLRSPSLSPQTDLSLLLRLHLFLGVELPRQWVSRGAVKGCKINGGGNDVCLDDGERRRGRLRVVRLAAPEHDPGSFQVTPAATTDANLWVFF